MPKQASTFNKCLAILAPLICLAAPSIWLLMMVPPLWRDVDAYIQLTSPPGPSTIVLHGPLYCALSRLPCGLGIWRAAAAPQSRSAISWCIRDSPMLVFTSSCGCSTPGCGLRSYLLSGITVSLTVRTTLAIFCASQPVFYAFAHCVGSETLSMIGIVFLVGTGLRIIHSYPKVPVRYWVVAGVILCCCILTRHINSVLVALLPLVIATIELRRFLKVKTQQDVGAPPFEFAQHMRPLVTSVVIGLAALLLANQLTGILARAAHIGWRSEVGFTFIWRLDFLQSMPAADRHQLLETIAARTSMPESRVFLRFLEAWEDRHPSWDPRDFAASARAASRLIGTKGFGARFHRSLNEVATAFLRPPPASLVSAAWNDFANATRFTQGAIARYLFAATEYVSKHPEVTPQSRGLSTFRDASESFMRFQTAPYFSLWDFLSIQGWLLTWLGLAGARPLLLKRNNSSRSPIVVYASGMIVIGILMTFLNCFFAQIQPRFALPMMELVLLPFIIVLGLLLTESAQSFRRNVR
jgi:hypothetical protein